MPPRSSHRPRPSPARPHLRRPDTALRGFLFTMVIGIGGLLFAMGLLPPLAAGGRAVERFSDEFSRIGTEVDLTFPRLPERSTIYAADGSVLATLFFEENRTFVRLPKVNPIARKAVLAIEDDRFYEHHGVDYRSIGRALMSNVQAGRVEQGASTITQQLARNVFKDIGKEQTLARKIQEAKVAMRLEEEYSKDEIFELYLNDVYFGRGVYGIGTAAEFYFGTTAKKLTLRQAATLAGLISAPEIYSPVNDKEAALLRRNVVIARMRDLGWISQEKATRVMGTKLGLRVTRVGNDDAKFPFFVDYLKRQILDDPRFGSTERARRRALFQGGLKIHTTLDPELQQAGERIVRERLPRPGDPESAIAAVEAGTGAVKALVGGRNFKQSQVNLATGDGGTGRQAGSAFKPFTLVAALEQGMDVGRMYRAASGQTVDCSPHGPSDYRVVNAGDGGGSGKVDLLTATSNSINAVFVQLAVDVGPPEIVDAAHRMGITSPLDAVCSITLGVEEVTPLEMASAFTTLANRGVHCEPFGISKVETRRGKTVFEQDKGECRQAIPKDVANDVAGMLRLVVTEGTGTAANLGTWPVFGKTGTTNDSADVWFDGCTRQICAATWVGHDEGRIEMPGAYGGTVAAPIWRDFMMVAMRGLPALPLPAVPEPKLTEVPNVVGQPREKAVEILTGANFEAAVEEVRSTEPADIVVGQSPAGGSSAPQGAVVTLSVSNGKAPAATVPDVVGLTEGAAKARLSAAGFRTNVGTQPTGKKALDGMVGSQSPGGGTSLASGSAVSITVYDYVKPKKEGGGKGAGKNDGKDDDGKGGGGAGGGGGGGRRGEDDRERPDR